MVRGKSKFRILLVKFLQELGEYGPFRILLSDAKNARKQIISDRKKYIERALGGFHHRVKEVGELVFLLEDECRNVGRPDMPCASSILIEEAIKMYSFIHAETDIGLDEDIVNRVWDEIERCFRLPSYRCNLRAPVFWFSMEDDKLDLRGGIQLRRPTLIDSYHLSSIMDHSQVKRHSVIAEIRRKSVHESVFFDKLDEDLLPIKEEAKVLEYLASCLRIFTALSPHMRFVVVEWEGTSWFDGHTYKLLKPIYIDWRDVQVVWDKPREDDAILSETQIGEFAHFWKQFIQALRYRKGQGFQVVIDRYNRGFIASDPSVKFNNIYFSLRKLIPGGEHELKERTMGLVADFVPSERESLYNFMDVVIECRHSDVHENVNPFTSQTIDKMKRYFPNPTNWSHYSKMKLDEDMWKAWFTDRLTEVTRQCIRYAILSDDFSNKDKWEKALHRAHLWGYKPVQDPPKWTKEGRPIF
jgi:hypothetical protein